MTHNDCEFHIKFHITSYLLSSALEGGGGGGTNSPSHVHYMGISHCRYRADMEHETLPNQSTCTRPGMASKGYEAPLHMSLDTYVKLLTKNSRSGEASSLVCLASVTARPPSIIPARKNNAPLACIEMYSAVGGRCCR